MKFPKGNWGQDGLTVDPSCPLVRFTVNGQQVLENTPVELPINCQIPESLELQMLRMIRQEVSRAAVAAGHESLDEAYDFDMAEDDSYEEELTPAELHAMVHARELTEEVPKAREKKDARKSSEGSGEAIGEFEGSASAGGSGSRDGGGREASENGGSHARAGDAPGQSRSAGGGRGRRVAVGSSGSSAEE